MMEAFKRIKEDILRNKELKISGGMFSYTKWDVKKKKSRIE